MVKEHKTLRVAVKGIDYRRFDIHYGRDDTVRNRVEREEFIDVRGSEGLIDEVLHDATIVVKECNFGARIALVDSQVHDSSSEV